PPVPLRPARPARPAPPRPGRQPRTRRPLAAAVRIHDLEAVLAGGVRPPLVRRRTPATAAPRRAGIVPALLAAPRARVGGEPRPSAGVPPLPESARHRARLP